MEATLILAVLVGVTAGGHLGQTVARWEAGKIRFWRLATIAVLTLTGWVAMVAAVLPLFP